MDMYGGYFHEICLYETFLKGNMYMNTSTWSKIVKLPSLSQSNLKHFHVCRVQDLTITISL